MALKMQDKNRWFCCTTWGFLLQILRLFLQRREHFFTNVYVSHCACWFAGWKTCLWLACVHFSSNWSQGPEFLEIYVKRNRQEDHDGVWSVFLWEVWMYFLPKCVSAFVGHVPKKEFSTIHACIFILAVHQCSLINSISQKISSHNK